MEDITLRVLRVLAGVDLILAEDTRRSGRLLQHYGIKKPLRSFFEGNEVFREEAALTEIAGGSRVALVTDAGTPALSDPGFRLVRRARELGLPIYVLPGPSAILTALVGSGLPTASFYFGGFLPRKSAARRRLLESLAGLDATLVFFESPHRLEKALADLEAVFGERPVVVARELTKRHEEFLRGRAAELREHFKTVPPRGEITLVVGGATPIPSGEGKEKPDGLPPEG